MDEEKMARGTQTTLTQNLTREQGSCFKEVMGEVWGSFFSVS